MKAPNNEPPDGDFVAYLRNIEREQIRALKLHGAAAEALVAAAEIVAPHPHGPRGSAAREGDERQRPLDRAQAAALRARLGDDSGTMRAVLVALALGFVGLVLLLSGLFGDGGWVLAGIGAILLWQAGRNLTAAVRSLQAGFAAPPRSPN